MGLAGELAEDQRLRLGRVDIGQVLEHLRDRPGLAEAECAVGQQGFDSRQPRAQFHGQPRHPVCCARRGGQRERELMSQRFAPGIRLACLQAGGHRRLFLVADKRPDDAELGRSRPRLDRCPTAGDSHQLNICRAVTLPVRARYRLKDVGQLGRRRASVPLAAFREAGQSLITGQAKTWTRRHVARLMSRLFVPPHQNRLDRMSNF